MLRLSRWFVIPLTITVLAGCSDDDDGGGAVEVHRTGEAEARIVAEASLCSEVFGEGENVDESDLDQLCIDADGEIQAYVTAQEDCDDGRTLYWNDHAWGYSDGEWREHDADGKQVAPEKERDRCNGDD